MRYRLSTLLIVLALSCVVAASFAAHLAAGLLAYLCCLLLFMSVWRTRVALHVRAAGEPDLHFPYDPVLDNLAPVGFALAAALAFLLLGSLAHLLCFEIFRLAGAANVASALGLFVSMPIATLGVLVVYWFSWPRQSAGETNHDAMPSVVRTVAAMVFIVGSTVAGLLLGIVVGAALIAWYSRMGGGNFSLNEPALMGMCPGYFVGLYLAWRIVRT